MDTFVLSVEEVDGLGEAVSVSINGVDLGALLRDFEEPLARGEGSPSIAGAYSGLRPEVVFAPSRRFLGESPLGDGWVAVLGCECGEEGCWPFDVRVEVTEDDVEWREFRQPHRMREIELPDGSMRQPWSYEGLGPFRFSRLQYEAQLDRAETMTLWRPVGPEELALIEEAEMLAFPPRLPEQPIFYPVLTCAYAQQIARDWNARDGRPGFVTRFDVTTDFLVQYPVEIAAGRAYQEYWIPADDLPAFNDAIVGTIEVVDRFDP